MKKNHMNWSHTLARSSVTDFINLEDNQPFVSDPQFRLRIIYLAHQIARDCEKHIKHIKTDKQLRVCYEKQIEHQLNSDLRIHNQREEIKRLTEDLEKQRREADHFKNVVCEMDQWKDHSSAFWKINTLEGQIRLLKSRLRGATRFLKGNVSYATLYKE